MSALNTLINKLPFELHIPTYQYCGPGTRVEKRLAKGQYGKNKLDRACRQHDIAYLNSKELSKRHQADLQLSREAWKRVISKDAGIGERFNSLLVSGAMKLKKKVGLGFRGKRSKVKSNADRKLGHGKPRRRSGVKPKHHVKGGILPVLLLLAALGGLLSGGSAVATAIKKAKADKQQLEEAQRHNKTVESLMAGKGLYLAPYKKGSGLFLAQRQRSRGKNR